MATQEKNHIAVIGGGIMGLTAAYELLKQGTKVTIYEADDRLGGMSASFDFDGLPIERFYHFICGPDTPLFNLCREMEIFQDIKWKFTKMGFFYKKNLYEWGSPVNLLKFPHLDLVSKLRYGFHIFSSIRRKNWEKLDKLNAVQWVKKNVGKKGYNLIWDSLFDLKFYEYKNDISAAWIWSRLKRVGLSRKNIFHEKLGYIEGGSQKLIDHLKKEIEERGGQIFLNSPVQQVIIENKKVKGVKIQNITYPYDQIVSTVPLPFIKTMIPNLSKSLLDIYNSIQNIGVVCVILKLKNPLTNYFWVNINDPSIGIPGIIEYSNLNPLNQKESIVYAPFYLHHTSPDFSRTDEEFYHSVNQYLSTINPDFDSSWIMAKRIHRYQYAQPICIAGFKDLLPPIKTEIDGLFIADTSYYYPEDRSISESIRLGKSISKIIESHSG